MLNPMSIENVISGNKGAGVYQHVFKGSYTSLTKPLKVAV